MRKPWPTGGAVAPKTKETKSQGREQYPAYDKKEAGEMDWSHLTREMPSKTIL